MLKRLKLEVNENIKFLYFINNKQYFEAFINLFQLKIIIIIIIIIKTYFYFEFLLLLIKFK